MAVKVRCPTCDKVLNAPDAARGKAVKCPGCDTKVKVPAGDTSAGGQTTSRRAAAKAPARQRAQADDDDEFLAGFVDVGSGSDWHGHIDQDDALDSVGQLLCQRQRHQWLEHRRHRSQ